MLPLTQITILERIMGVPFGLGVRVAVRR